MIRRIMDFVLVLIFVWACMLLGLWIIDTQIVNLPAGPSGDGISNTIKAVFAVSLVLAWLWIWREITKRMFWSTLKRG